jgi:hypothetical protein
MEPRVGGQRVLVVGDRDAGSGSERIQGLLLLSATGRRGAGMERRIEVDY